MRSLVWTGWLMVAAGAAIGAGAAVSGIAGGVPFGALMFAALAGGGAFMIWLGRGWDRPLESTSELYEWGRPANATVRKVEHAQLDAHGTRTAKVTVHVTPRNERAYKATQRIELPGGRIPQAGETVTVKFDPNRRRRFVLLADTYEVRDSVQQAADSLARIAQPPRA